MEAAEAASQELQPFFKPFKLYSYFTQHISEKRLFLRRNLSYYAPERSAKYQTTEATHIISLQLKTLQLAPVYTKGLVIYAAVCRQQCQGGRQVLVPLVAKAVLLRGPWAPPLPALQLPVTLAAGLRDQFEDLVILLLHQPHPGGSASAEDLPPEYRLLDVLGRSGALADRGGKSVSCDLERRGTFGWPQPGASVLHFALHLHDRRQHEAAVGLLQGVFHPLPPAAGQLGAAGLTIVQPQRSEAVRLEYRVEIRRQQAAAGAGGEAAAQVRLAGAGGEAAAQGRLAGAGGGPAASGSQRRQQQQQQPGQPPQGIPWLPPRGSGFPMQRQPQQQGQPLQQQQQLSEQQQGQPPGRLTGLKRKHADALGRAPPPLQHLHQQRGVWVSLWGMDGLMQMEQQIEGNICIICNLRCRSFSALKQHLLASHDYFEFGFTEDRPDIEPEIAMRCRRELYDASGEFLPAKQLCNGDRNLQLMKPWQTDTFWYNCPPSERHMRWLPSFSPRFISLKKQEFQDGSRGSDNLADGEGESQYSGGALASMLISEGSGIKYDYFEEEEDEELLGDAASTLHPGRAGARSGGAAARQKPPRKSVRRKRAPKAAPTPRAQEGLALLTPDGRLKFYHSRTCVALTQQELLADNDSDDDSDSAEWQRDCWQRLYEAGEQGVKSQAAFMFAWDHFLHRNPLHADADVPKALAQFRQQQAAAGLASDPTFHRRFACMVTNLWKYRLLTPDQAFELLKPGGDAP